METDAGPIIEIPATALTKINQNPRYGSSILDKWTVSIRNVDVLRFDQAQGGCFPWARYRRNRGHSGRAGPPPGSEDLPAWIRTMIISPNGRSSSRSLVAYIMIVPSLRVCASYFRLGRSEDPSFIIKTMVVQAAWPGATVEETIKQVTERLERKLQETPHLDFMRSFTRPGSPRSL